MKLLNKLVVVFLLALFSISCGDDDGEMAPTTPNVTYAETTFDADFYTAGNSSAPTISWNGNQGNFTISPSVEGLSINSTSGQISWTKTLPPGTHNADVVVTNSAGQTVVPITINNPLKGMFSGTYNGAHYFAAEFVADGTLTIYANDEADPNVGPGTWEINGDEITADYTYETLDDEYSIRVVLSQTSTSATLEGSWYVDHGAEESNLGGDVSLEFMN